MESSNFKKADQPPSSRGRTVTGYALVDNCAGNPNQDRGPAVAPIPVASSPTRPADTAEIPKKVKKVEMYPARRKSNRDITVRHRFSVSILRHLVSSRTNP